MLSESALRLDSKLHTYLPNTSHKIVTGNQNILAEGIMGKNYLHKV